MNNLILNNWSPKQITEQSWDWLQPVKCYENVSGLIAVRYHMKCVNV